MYLMLIFYDTGRLRNKGLRKYKRLSALISSAEMHGGGEIEMGEGADGKVVEIHPGFYVQMKEHSASLPLVRLSLQRELWPMQRKAKSYFKVCFLREELEARLLRPSTVAQIPRLDFWVLCLKPQQHHMYWEGVLIKSACLLNFSFI